MVRVRLSCRFVTPRFPDPVPTDQVVRAQEQDEAEAGEESTESRGMRELARLPFHQQVRYILSQSSEQSDWTP